jgi:hypothetical protein
MATTPAVLYLNLGAQYAIVDKGDRKLVLYGLIKQPDRPRPARRRRIDQL